MKFKNKINNKAQAEVIGTVLLILLAIGGIAIIAGFIIPYVTNQTSTSDCVSVTDMKISNDIHYTCYDNTSKQLSVQVHFGDLQNKVSGFILSVSSSGSSKNYQITNQSSVANVSMYDGSSPLIIPGKNEEKTYNISNVNSLPDAINIYPILNNGKSCDAADSYTSIELC